MKRGAIAAGALALIGVGACSSDGKLEIRALKAPVSATSMPVPERIAEAQAQLALGNVALALESYRKASREDPGSVHALLGMATCYDMMRRFDLGSTDMPAGHAAEADGPGIHHLHEPDRLRLVYGAVRIWIGGNAHCPGSISARPGPCLSWM